MTGMSIHTRAGCVRLRLVEAGAVGNNGKLDTCSNDAVKLKARSKYNQCCRNGGAAV